jgi:Membrane bound FAD containing D-sorbitol dehydrogenase
MSNLPRQERRPIAADATDDEHGITRRTVLAGAAASTAAATIAALDAPARAHSVDANSPDDMNAFVQLSAALTGIDKGKLSPFVDPVDIKRDYFKWVNEREPAAFENLLRIAKENAGGQPDPAQPILAKLLAGDATLTPSEIEAKYLARSIVLMWYLGAWYDPHKLRPKVIPSTPGAPESDASPLDFEVISPKAYTQAWALRVAQAHPMGFSEMQFGYWAREPDTTLRFIGRDIPRGA